MSASKSGVGAAFNGIQAVILCEGNDSRLYPLTENQNHKSLLPVANIPILVHQLRLVESAGFADVLIVVEKDALAHIQRTAEAAVSGLACSFREVAEESGTADMLRQLSDIKSDMLVIGPDVIANCALHDLVDLHRLRGSSATCLVTAKMEPRDGGVENKKKDGMEDKDIVGLDSSNQWGTVFDEDQAQHRLLYLATGDELNEGLNLRTSMIRRCPSLTLHTGLVDSTIYVLAPWTLQILQAGQAGQHFSSLKDELLPYLVRHQHRSSLKNIPAEAKVAREQATLHVENMTSVLPVSSSSQLVQDNVQDVVQCYVLVPPKGIEGKDIFCLKASSVLSYIELNRAVAFRRRDEAGPLWKEVQEHELPHRLGRGKCDRETLVSEAVSVADKTTIKKSVVGARSAIGEQCRIATSVIMENVKIGNRVKLENCVVCSGAEIADDCDLTHCKVGYNYQVSNDTKCKNETLCDEQDFDDDDDDFEFE